MNSSKRTRLYNAMLSVGHAVINRLDRPAIGLDSRIEQRALDWLESADGVLGDFAPCHPLSHKSVVLSTLLEVRGDADLASSVREIARDNWPKHGT